MSQIKKTNKPFKKESEVSNHILFSFKHLSNNKKHSFNFFKDLHKKMLAYEGFIKRMKELCEHPVIDFLSMSKNAGFETIPVKQLNKSIKSSVKQIDIISEDSKLTVFRFCENSYRMICKSDNKEKHIFYIVLFDFDYSAYPHG